MTNAKYGFQFCRDGRWFTARGIGTWEELRAEFLEHYPDALVRVFSSLAPGIPVAYEGRGRDMPEGPPQLPTHLAPLTRKVSGLGVLKGRCFDGRCDCVGGGFGRDVRFVG